MKITIKDWFRQQVRRQLIAITGIFLILFGFSYFAVEYTQKEKNEQYANRLTILLSQAVQQKNRNTVEALLLGAYHDLSAKNISLCEGAKSSMSFPVYDEKICTQQSGYRIYPILGNADLKLLVQYRTAFSLYFLLVGLGFYSLILFGFITFSRKLKRGFEKELISPLANGFNEDSVSGIAEIEELKKKILDWSKIQIESEKNKALTSMAAQIAHDIRSPLAVLTEGVKDNFSNPDFMKLAVERIESIANDLLKERKKGSAGISSVKSLNELLALLVQEKKIQYKNSNPSINVVVEKNTPDLGISLVDLSRVLSNLLNNALEAGNNPKVKIETKCEQGFFQIIISDNGAGIPPEVIEKLGTESITTKSSGNGLGLLDAFKKMKDWGGELLVETESGKGTLIYLNFPVQKKISPLTVLVDDDDLVRMTWESKAKAKAVHFRSFPSSQKLFSALDSLAKNTLFYLDLEIEGSDLSGGELARHLRGKGFNELYVASGHEIVAPEILSLFKRQHSKKCPF